MKKQVLILTICLALTAISALASDMPYPSPFPNPIPQVKKVTQSSTKADPPAKEAPCTKQVPANNEACLSSEHAKMKFEEKRTKDRDDLYCKLSLTPEQKAKAEALDKTNRETAKPLMSKLRQERAKLHELKAKKAGMVEISKQKMQVKLAKKALKEHFEASQKSFESILTECQLTKFKAIKEERKAEMKKHGKHHHGCKHNFCKPGCPCHVDKK